MSTSANSSSMLRFSVRSFLSFSSSLLSCLSKSAFESTLRCQPVRRDARLMF